MKQNRRRYKLWSTNGKTVAMQCRCFQCYWLNTVAYIGYLEAESVRKFMDGLRCSQCRHPLMIDPYKDMRMFIHNILFFEQTKKVAQFS